MKAPQNALVAEGNQRISNPLPSAANDGDLRFAEYLRLQDARKLYGLKKAFLYGLLNEGIIESISVTKPNKRRGCRLLVHNSLRLYLDNLRREQNPEKEAA
jgi:hypothetical protein